MTRNLLACGLCLVFTLSIGCGANTAGEDALCDGAAAACGVDTLHVGEDSSSDAVDLELQTDTQLADLQQDLDVSDVMAADADTGSSVQDVEDTTPGELLDAEVLPDDAVGDVAPPTPEAFVIRYATYNVRTSNLNNSAWGDNHVGWDSNDAARMRRIADTIADQNLTVVAAQEMRRAERDTVLARLADAYGESWGHSTQKQGADDTYVLFDKSGWRRVDETHYLIPMQDGLNDRYQIGALLEHKATGRRVWFYSVHLAAGGASGASARKTGAVRTLNSIQNHADANDLPFVLGGDFNCTASDPPGDVLRNSGIMKYTRSRAEVLVGDGCNTFNSKAGSAGAQSCPGGQARHIDQVWVSKPGMKVHRYKVTATAHTSRSSDHNPVTTILEKL